MRAVTLFSDGRVVLTVSVADRRSALVFSIRGLPGPAQPLSWACEVGLGRFFSVLGLWKRRQKMLISEQVSVFEAFDGVVSSEWTDRERGIAAIPALTRKKGAIPSP
jgi:hypothetical protein